MSRLYNTFEFVGNIQLPKSAERFHKEETFDPSGWTKHTLNFAVQESKTNSVFVQMEGGYSKKKSNTVNSFSKGTENNPGSKIEIPWDDRNKEETLDMIADFKKIVVDFTKDQKVKEESGQVRYEIRSIEYKDEKTEEDVSKLKELKSKLKEIDANRREFTHPYDAILFLADNLEKYAAHKFRITGDIKISHWKGKFYRNFEPTMIEIVSDEERNKLRATMDVFFTNESLDDADFDEEKKVYINGYLLSYDGGHKKDKFFPTQFVINGAKIDMENPDHVKKLNFLKRKFEVEDGVYHLQWEVNIFRGADQVEFTEEQLTDAQKESIEFGYNKLEDFKPKGGVLGETVVENRLVKPVLMAINNTNDFTNGAAETPYDEDDLIYVAPVQKKKDEPKKEEETKKEEVQEENKGIGDSVELDDFDLFG